jgi:neutral trehalase
MTLWRSARNPLYIEVEGLEWETLDRYRDEIKTQGIEKWKQDFQTASEWRRRTEMLRDFIESSLVS